MTEKRGPVEMKGKKTMVTYWLLDSDDQNPVPRKPLPDQSKYKPFFKSKNLRDSGNANSQEILKRRSPRMSMASTKEFMHSTSFRETQRHTPDSVRNSQFQLSGNSNRPGDNIVATGIQSHTNGTPPVEKDNDSFM